MAIRAFDYLPPVDITFGDFLRALVTADSELVPEDDRGLRASMIEAFRSAASTRTTSFPSPRSRSSGEPDGRRARPSGQPPPTGAGPLGPRLRPVRAGTPERRGPDRRLGPGAPARANENARALDLDPGLRVGVEGFHTVFRVSPEGNCTSSWSPGSFRRPRDPETSFRFAAARRSWRPRKEGSDTPSRNPSRRKSSAPRRTAWESAGRRCRPASPRSRISPIRPWRGATPARSGGAGRT